jgi:hypothetical protein
MQKLGILLSTLLLLLLPLSCSSGSPPEEESAVGATSQAVTATATAVHEVWFNVGKTFAVNEGDTIRLKGFPSGWTYTSVEINFDGAPQQMDLVVAERGNSYAVTGWNDKVVVPYRGTPEQDLVVARGSGNIRVHFWVSSGPLSPPDAAPEGPAVRELAAINTPLPLTTGGGTFRISTFPGSPYNVVVVRVEARDGKPLTGQLSAGGVTMQLSGTSHKTMFKERGNLPVYFDLAFPSPRSVAVTWWVENRTPQTKVVPRTTTTSGTTIAAKYRFTDDHAVDADLALSFTSTDFSDGAAPTITRLEHNKPGVRYPDRPEDLFGPTYDIHAQPKAGKRIQVAIPVPELATIRGIDEADITILHHNPSTNTVNEIVPDRIENGYVYFTTDSFSSFWSRMKRKAKKAVAVVVDAVVTTAVVTYNTTVTIADGLKDGIKEAYKSLVSTLCSTLELSTYKKLIFDRARQSPAKPDLTQLAASTDFDPVTLATLATAALTPYALAHSDPAVEDHLEEWRASKKNAEIMLADVLLAARTGKRRFSRLPVGGGLPGPFTSWATAYVIYDDQTKQSYNPLQLFRFTSPLFAAAPRLLQMIQECDGMVGLADEFNQTAGHVVDAIKEGTRGDLGDACREVLMLPADLVDWVVPDALTCGVEVLSWLKYASGKGLKSYFDMRDALVLDASAFLNVAGLLLWADPELRDVWELSATTLRNQMHSFLGIVHEGYTDNNIAIKAMAGVAFWDLVSKGDKATYRTFSTWLEAKTGDATGYAEGTGYLEYVNQDVPYLLAAAVRSSFIGRNELPPKYLKTGEWLLNATPFKGGNPVEVDDGVTYPPDFIIYSFLNNDLRYQAFSKDKTPLVSEALRPLGFTSAVEQATMRPSAVPILPNTYFADGIGVVRAKSGADTIALSVVAESGNLRLRGTGHDQQDNGSVTLAHSTLGQLIVDPGYSGFSNRHNNPCASAYASCPYARFESHNVVMTEEDSDFHGESANPLLTYHDALKVLANQPHVNNLDFLDSNFEAGGKLVLEYIVGGSLPTALTWGALATGWSFYRDQATTPLTDASAGGADATLFGQVQSLVSVPVHGLEIKHTSTAGVTNHRFLASYSDYMWILDRPEAKRTLWSRTNWTMSGPAAGAHANAFQIPASPDAGDVRLSIPQQDGAPAREVQQRTHRAGSASQSPVFVTGFPNDNVPKGFAEVPCQNAVCMSRSSAQGDDLIIVPHWGESFNDCRFFQGFVKTGQIVFARRTPGSTIWRLRLVGEEAAAVAAGSLGSQTGYAADAVYQVGPGPTLQATFPNGTTRSLVPANGIDDFTVHTYSQIPDPIDPNAYLPIARSFGRTIETIKVTIVAGDADDIGYVGNMQVTTGNGTCGSVGNVTSPVDVTSQVTFSGDTANLYLKARDTCGLTVGWGSATQPGRADARLHWEVTFADGC